MRCWESDDHSKLLLALTSASASTRPVRRSLIAIVKYSDLQRRPHARRGAEMDVGWKGDGAEEAREGGGEGRGGTP